MRAVSRGRRGEHGRLCFESSGEYFCGEDAVERGPEMICYAEGKAWAEEWDERDHLWEPWWSGNGRAPTWRDRQGSNLKEFVL